MHIYGVPETHQPIIENPANEEHSERNLHRDLEDRKVQLES